MVRGDTVSSYKANTHKKPKTSKLLPKCDITRT